MTSMMPQSDDIDGTDGTPGAAAWIHTDEMAHEG